MDHQPSTSPDPLRPNSLGADSIPPDPLAGLAARLAPDLALSELLPELRTAVAVDFIGIAMRPSGSDRFVVVGAADGRRDGGRKNNSNFAAGDTVGAWVERTKLPFVSRTVRDVQRFRGTARDMERHGFASSIVMPVDLGDHSSGVFYALSQSPNAFSPDSLAVLARVQRIVQPLTSAWIAARDFVGGEPRASLASAAAGLESGWTLEEVERHHIAGVLNQTNQVIEGPRGAAKILGLKPSTLRSKLRKLGMR